MGDCEQSIKGRYRGTSKAGPNSLCSVSLWTGSLFGEKTRKGKGKASVTGQCSVIGSLFRTTDHTECIENGAKCTLGTRGFSREQRGASRVSLFKTWPKLETAHEKPLAPSVRETGIRWKKIGREGRKREIGGMCEQFLQAGPLGQTAERESRILHVVDQDQQYKLFPDNS